MCIAGVIQVILGGILTFCSYLGHHCWRFLHEKPGMAEGVGFEPTVGYPTLDFESSALNRTQPPFRKLKKTPNAQRRISKPECNHACLDRTSQWGRGLPRHRWLGISLLGTQITCLTKQKMLQLKACHVWQAYCILYVHTDSHAITCC